MQLENKNWVRAHGGCEAPYFRKVFSISSHKTARLAICGLGCYELFLNGKQVSREYFIPVTSDYHKRDTSKFLYPIHDEFTHRTYYDVYDVTAALRPGKNVIAVALGNGWYNQHARQVEGYAAYGKPRLAFCMEVAGEEDLQIVSDESMCWCSSEVVYNNLFCGEKHDLRLALPNWTEIDFDDTGWEQVKAAEPLETQLCKSDCPGDKIIRQIVPKKISQTAQYAIYDAGECLTGWVLVQGIIKNGETVTIHHAEALTPGGELDFSSCGGVGQIQTVAYTGNGEAVAVHPKFSWQAFRYFEVRGKVHAGQEEPFLCQVVHADVQQASSFESSHKTLNWMYDAYVRTQLTNIHAGVLLDTPARERLGYTGDGQLCCETVMLLLDSQRIYKKWIQDVLDCQDIHGGRVQHTAPFQGGGGGPAGWGCAIAEVPYQYYRRFRDKQMLTRCYEPICRWFTYLENRSEKDLVVKGEAGGWCLGDWNAPQQMQIPAPFVNTYFYIKSLYRTAEMADILGKKEDAGRFRVDAQRKKDAIIREYYNKADNHFCKGVQGADAYAIDLGIGNPEMLEALDEKYASMDQFDTGIFGTEIVLRVLFSHGYAQTAFDLLTAAGPASYETMRRQGATTFFESWHDRREALNHPMYSAPTKFLFTELLGIHLLDEKTVSITPQLVQGLDNAKGSVKLANGLLSVAYKKAGENVEVTVVCPPQIEAALQLFGKTYPLAEGCNNISASLK